jgi:O-antigen/teichoic acid export membrane protein
MTDSIARRLASRSIVIFGLRILGAGFIFLAQAAIARVWGSEALGDYLLVVATANLLAVMMPLGFQTIGTYFTAEYAAQGEGRQLRRFLVRCYGHVFVVGGLIVLFGMPITYLMGEAGDHLRPLWTPAALLALGTAAMFVNSAVLVGLKRPLAGFVADMIFRPLLVISIFAILAAVVEGPALSLMLWLLALSFLTLVGIHFLFVLAAARAVPLEGEMRSEEEKRWWRFAMPWVLITLASDFFFDINLILLAGLLSRADLAIFGVCTRIFSLVSFGIVAVYALNLPEMFEANAADGREGIRRRLGDANVVATLLALVLFVMVGAGGWLALKLFGDEFVAGALPLTILCLSLVVRAMFGPASLVLSMHDRPYASLPAVGFGLVVLVVGNMVLVPPHGLMGAAISAFIAITTWSAMLWATALWRAKIDVSIFTRLRQLATA